MLLCPSEVRVPAEAAQQDCKLDACGKKTAAAAAALCCVILLLRSRSGTRKEI